MIDILIPTRNKKAPVALAQTVQDSDVVACNAVSILAAMGSA